MKRFAMLFGTLVLTIQIAGCGGGAEGTAMTGPATRDDSNRPAEEKEFEAQRKAEIEKKTAALEAKAAKKAKP
ncbi:MAG TPA: hypothetical protein VGH33_05735 [Isosphaeraceae bacterium]|jgi:hypothetical protein